MAGDPLDSYLPSIAILTPMALAALLLTILRPARFEARAPRRLLRLTAVAIVVQVVHFCEEWATGLYARFPELFGLAPVPESAFVEINLFALAIWMLSLLGIYAAVQAALFPVWFLAIASAFNGVLHPGLALADGGYFPGLWSSLVAGVVGVLLLRRLAIISRPGGDAATA